MLGQYPDWKAKPADTRWWMMVEWHRDRCAVCGLRPARLLRDHDHWSNLFRGLLCPSCNTLEGITETWPLIARYRERHPAIIFNLKIRQTVNWSPLYVGGVPKNPPYYG